MENLFDKKLMLCVAIIEPVCEKAGNYMGHFQKKSEFMGQQMREIHDMIYRLYLKESCGYQ